MRIKEIFLVSLITVLCSMKNFSIEKKFNDQNDEISWSESKNLGWEDFKGIPDTVSSIMLAETASTINFEYSVTNNMLTSYKVESLFIKSKSWTVTNDIKLLAHEQLHFDITELYARKIRKAFDSLRIRKNFNEENYSLIYNSNILKRNDLNKLYDSQVYGNNIRQSQWIKKIKNEILKLKKYEYVSSD